MSDEPLAITTDEHTGRTGMQIVATLLGGVLLLTALLARFLWPQPFYAGLIAMMAAALLATPLVIQSFKGLAAGKTMMNELAALGVLAAFAAGAVGGGADAVGYYLTAGTVSFFVLLANLIERRSALGARMSIESLIRLTPTHAAKITSDGNEVKVEAKDLVPGDIVRVRPGDNIPGDGRVVAGRSSVNQATITGESLPVDKDVGTDVFGGTINLTGALDIEITKVGADTTLGRVQELILQAEHSRSPIMRLIDRYAAWYTPTIIMVAGIVLIFTRNINHALTILIIAVPSAIVLSTPAAMVAALSAAARLGVLIKNITDLETACGLTAIVFDKTGTLTTGELSVTRLQPADGVEGGQLLAAAAAAEQSSRHPVARAVVEVARRARLTLADAAEFEEFAGHGVRAVIDGDEVLVGRQNWLAERGVDVSSLDVTDAEGLSLLVVTRAGRLLGWIGLEDKTRADAADALDALRDIGLQQLVMVTGDRWSVAKRVAAEIHCTDVQAEVLPDQKLKIVNDLKAAGHWVAVVGDGVNDAPALAAGDISIAMGAAGSDVAIHSASIALMNNNLNRIPFLVLLSRQAVRVSRQNLAFSVSLIILVICALPFVAIHPIEAVLLHVFSSLVVLFNSARLVREGEDLDRAPAAAENFNSESDADAIAAQPVPVT